MRELELFLSVDSDDEAHDVPQTFMPGPKYFVRGSEKKHSLILLVGDSPCDSESRYLSLMKAAMGRELVEGYDVHANAVKSNRLLDDWDFILGADAAAP